MTRLLRGEINEARKALMLGCSLEATADRIGATTDELDQALWRRVCRHGRTMNAGVRTSYIRSMAMNTLANQGATWTAAHETVLRSLWADASKSSDEVGLALCRTWASCRVKAGLMKLGRRPSGVPTEKNAFWTAERVEILRAGIADGMSHSQIANKIGHGCTRGACIGKAHRLGLSQPAKPSTPTLRFNSSTRARPPAPRPAPKVQAGNQVLEDLEPRPTRAVIPSRAWEPLEGSNPRHFTDSCFNRFLHCNWPVGDGVEMRCAQPIERGSYCGVHRGRAHVAARPRDPVKELMRSVRRYA